MSIPYNDNLKIDNYQTNLTWYLGLQAPLTKSDSQAKRALGELYYNQSVVRFVQFIRDTARLLLKVPYRAIATPIILEKNWQERERAKVNVKLTGYAFVQLVYVPVKFIVALVALGISARSQENAKWLLDTNEEWTAYLDGRASQLEALKEEGAKTVKAENRDEFEAYRRWLYSIDPKLCRKLS